MIDTVTWRLYGINDIYISDLNKVARSNGGGWHPFIVPAHQALYIEMLRFKGKHFKMTRSYRQVHNDTTNMPQDEYVASMFSDNAQELTVDYMEFRDSNKPIKKIPLSTRGKMRTPSSINYVKFTINENGGYIEFEFSIPKFLYGHSLAEFVPQGGSETAINLGGIHKLKNLNFQARFIHVRLISFLKKFLEELTRYFKIDIQANVNFIEIRRVDLCWNQYYPSKEEAFLALREKKKLNSKRHRQNQKNINDYKTSLAYLSSNGSYFKIYHKGTEYSESKDGDLKKHEEVNKAFLDKKLKESQENETDATSKWIAQIRDHRDLIEKVFHDTAIGKQINMDAKKRKKLQPVVKKLKNRLPYDVIFLKQEMDKVLRHELSLRGSFFKYAYKTKVFRKNDAPHLKAMEVYRKVKAMYDCRNADQPKPLKREHDLHQKMHRWLNRGIALTLSNHKYILAYNKVSANEYYRIEDYDIISQEYRIKGKLIAKTKLADKDTGVFSKELLHECFLHFKKLCQDFEVKSVKPDLDVASKILKYNDKAQEIREIYDTVNHHKTLDRRGKPKIKGSRIIRKAHQLLTEKERAKKKMQKINPAPLIGVLNHMTKGGSMKEYFKLHKITSSSQSRYKKQLENFQIFENTIMNEIPIKEERDFNQMYWNTSSYLYREKFYLKKKDYQKN